MVTPQASTGSTEGEGEALSLRAYGRHRKARGLPGGNPVAVSRAIKTERLRVSVAYVEGEAKIADAALADAEWAANTDHSRAPGFVKEASGASGVTSATVTPFVTGGARNTGRRVAHPGALAQASTREKNARANLAELDYLAKAGELVSAQAVEAAWADLATQARTAVLSVPSKYKALVPHLSHAEVAQLNELLCQALEGVADRAAAIVTQRQTTPRQKGATA